MRIIRAFICHRPLFWWLGAVTVLAGCAAAVPDPAVPSPRAGDLPLPPAAWRKPVETYALVAKDSRVVALVYRAGPLAEAGKNHTVATSALTGCALVNHQDATWVGLRLPLAKLEVDLPADRERAGGAFTDEISATDIEATRKNMLGEEVLAVADFPTARFTGTLAPGADTLQGTLALRGREQPVTMNVELVRGEDTVQVTGEGSLRQSDFGITPFAVFMGALRVADEVDLRYRLTFRRASNDSPCATQGAP